MSIATAAWTTTSGMRLAGGLAAPPKTPPPGTPAPKVTIPAFTPNFDAPGVKGLTSLGGMVAAVVLVTAVLAILVGVMLAVFGPRLGFHGAKGLGMGGIVGGFAVGMVVAVATPGVETIYTWFA